MAKKAKFRPEIVKVKLDSEQAVLTCVCYDVGHYNSHSVGSTSIGYCYFSGSHKYKDSSYHCDANNVISS